MKEEIVTDILKQDPPIIMKEFLEEKPQDEFISIYPAKVVDNNDPDKLGRCKVRVFGLFSDEIPDDDLPWAIPDNTFIGSKVGSFIIPPKDALVNVYFDRGELYLPKYTTKVLDSSNMPTAAGYTTDYPDTMVLYCTDAGDYFKINRKTNETTFNHKSGTKILIKENGQVEITVKADEKEQVDGKKTTNVTGGEYNIKSSTDPLGAVGGMIKIETGTGGQITINGGIVIPAPSGGPFNCLPNCMYLGMTHQGTTVVKT